MDPRISKALETWHGGEGDIGMMNCSLSMLGELGEITNLYRKRIFKPGYVLDREVVLDELGDIWYYVRIFAYLTHQNDLKPFIDHFDPYIHSLKPFPHSLLIQFHTAVLWVGEISLGALLDKENTLYKLVSFVKVLLQEWNCSLDELTELNHKKLTKNVDHHGWKASEDLQKMPIEEYKRLTQNTWVEYDEGLEKEVESAAEMYKESLEKMKTEPPYAIFPQQEENDESSSYENVPLQEEDWREGMQKRIALLKQESIEKRGRWY